MYILGLDLATTTGYVVLEDGKKIVSKGTIPIASSLPLPERLGYFDRALEEVIVRERSQRVIDHIAIEDIMLASSGAPVMSYLARLSGVAILRAYRTLSDPSRIHLYLPSRWKANSCAGLKGNAQKWQVLLAVARHFSFPIDCRCLEETMAKFEQRKGELNTDLALAYNDRVKAQSSIAAKRHPISAEMKEQLSSVVLPNIEAKIKDIKAQQRKLVTDTNKAMSKFEGTISAQTGVTSDMADAAGVAICCARELELL